jgi:hypothetical protein
MLRALVLLALAAAVAAACAVVQLDTCNLHNSTSAASSMVLSIQVSDKSKLIVLNVHVKCAA